jgi:hypothetical protein
MMRGSHRRESEREGVMTSVCVRSCVALIVILGVGACSKDRQVRQEPTTTAPVSAGPSQVSERESAQRIQSAMISIHWHAIRRDVDQAPPQIRPMPLLDAARIVAAQTGRFAEADRRTAIAVLAADDVDFHKDALLVLHAPLPAIIAILQHLPPNTTLREKAIYARLDEDGPAVANCEATIISPPDVVPDPPQGEPSCSRSGSNLGVNRVTTTAQVSGTTRDKLSRAMDPQSWDVCMHDYFDATYVANPVTNPSTVPCYDPPAATSPPSPGSNWSGSLFERFNIVSIFRNFLDINSTGTSGYLVKYCLSNSVCSEVPWLPPFSGGIDVDEGHLNASASASAGTYSLEVVKYVRFAGWPPSPYDPWIPSMTAAALKNSGDSILKLACCDTTAPAPPGPPILVP